MPDNTPPPSRILLSEGTSLSAREAVTSLGRSGRKVEICAPAPLCFAGYSKWVRRVHVVPALGADPGGYVRAVADLCVREPIDVLLPVHEQAYLFAALRHRDRDWPSPHTSVPVAPLAAYEAVQTKSALAATLAAAGLPQPATFVARTPEELLNHGTTLLRADGACIVKANAGTASVGLERVRDQPHLEKLCAAFAAAAAPVEPAVVQQLVVGPLERIEAVFFQGTMTAVHCSRQLIEGPGGGDVLKESVSRPASVAHLQLIGERLRWNGALAFDYLLESGNPDRPRYIDANPRLVEPLSAHLSGANLTDALIRVARGEAPGPLAIGRPGVRTRLGIPGLLERAIATGRRRTVVADFANQVLAHGRYQGSVEELTPYQDDVRSAIPLLGVLASLLVKPASAPHITRATVESYALGPRGHAYIRALT